MTLPTLPTLITGATGFLGSEIARQFDAHGVDIVTTGRAKRAALPGYRSCDLTRSDDLESLVTGIGCIVHAAGLAHLFKSPEENHPSFFDVNVSATENLAMAAANASVDHFVHISSVSVYGGWDPGLVTEESACHPMDEYARTKYEAERRLISLARRNGMQLTILRLATIYGEGDPGNVARLIRAIDQGGIFWVGRGENRKTLIHREDAARAIMVAAQRPDSPRIEVFNVAAPAIRMRELVETLASATGKKIPRAGIPKAFIEPPLRLAHLLFPGNARFTKRLIIFQKFLRNEAIDGRKFTRVFDFGPFVDPAEGLRREVAWFRSSEKKKLPGAKKNLDGAPSSR